MENGPFEDVFPIKNGDIPASYVSLQAGTLKTFTHLIVSDAMHRNSQWMICTSLTPVNHLKTKSGRTSI